MKKNYIEKLAATFLLCCGLLAPQINATDGYFSNGIGIQYRAMAGAGIALYLSPLSVATNPASLAFLGTSYDINISLFNPNRKYSVSGTPSFQPGTFGLNPTTVESGTTAFVIPSMAASWALDSTKSLGLAIYGNGGMNTDYDAPVFGFQTTGINLLQLFVAPTFAMKVAGNHSFGVTPILAYQSFEANGLLAFGQFSSNGANISNNGSSASTGFGVRVGYLGKINDMISIGAAYQTKIKMGKFDKYSGLFAEQGGFDIAANWTAGIALQFDKLGIALDFKQILYSQVKSIANPILPNLQTAQLGNETGAGFGWEDMSVIKIGIHYAVQNDLILRAGFSTGGQPIPDSEVLFNILAPGVVENHVSFGISKGLANGKEVNIFITRALSNTVSGGNPLEFPGQQTIDLTMDQWEFGVGFSF
ncbi:MAG: outer membrane protein transport protein [Saprospiraceae bacterium]